MGDRAACAILCDEGTVHRLGLQSRAVRARASVLEFRGIPSGPALWGRSMKWAHIGMAENGGGALGVEEVAMCVHILENKNHKEIHVEE